VSSGAALSARRPADQVFGQRHFAFPRRRREPTAENKAAPAMRHELESALALAQTLSPAELPAFLGELEHVRIVALTRISSPAVEARPDQLVEVPEAADRLGVSTDYLYRHSKRFPFTRRMGRKLLFSSNGLDLYLRKR